MIESEVATLLGFMAAFDRRTVGPVDIEAWSSLEWVKRATLEEAKAAVSMYRNAPADDKGWKPYLDDVELHKWVRKLHDAAEAEERRMRAIRYTRHQQLEADRYADTNIDKRVISAMLNVQLRELDAP